MSLKIEELLKKLSEAKMFLELERDNRRNENKRLFEDNQKLSNKVVELEEKLKIIKGEKDETNSDDSLIQDLED